MEMKRSNDVEMAVIVGGCNRVVAFDFPGVQKPLRSSGTQWFVTLTGDLGARSLRRLGLFGGDPGWTSARTPLGSGELIPAMAAKSMIPYSRATAIG